ncbi:YaiI/YqxD family protein [Desulfatiferula olefinivorans]
MRLFIDGDAFPNLLKPIVLRAVERLRIETVVVSNKPVVIGPSKHITSIVVGSKIDEADQRIAGMVEAGDLVITADIPLADSVISKNAHAVNHHGDLFTEANIKDCLSMRNLMREIRDSGMMTKGAAPFSARNAAKFADTFSRFLSKYADRDCPAAADPRIGPKGKRP